MKLASHLLIIRLLNETDVELHLRQLRRFLSEQYMAKLKEPISSRNIMGGRCTPKTENTLRATIPGMSSQTEVNLMVFEVQIDKQVRYCCWSGGTMHDDQFQNVTEPRVTPVGQAALEALAGLPFADPQGALVMNELRIGATPLREKVLKAFRRTADTRELICFIGDIAGELDGHMHKAFNMNGSVNWVDCVGLKKPWE